MRLGVGLAKPMQDDWSAGFVSAFLMTGEESFFPEQVIQTYCKCIQEPETTQCTSPDLIAMAF